uniref:Trans-cinnamate 4-monooxygenase n=1 Tax=Quercus lobata TaxID=97700 RepID=A0A7N2ME82_QUELO
MLGPGVQITKPNTYKLPYLKAVIKETLWVRMAIPLLVPHMNLQDAKLGRFDIPGESKIPMNAWWLANNPGKRKNPQDFRPKRFLEEEAKVGANGNDFRYLPFGVGRRSCTRCKSIIFEKFGGHPSPHISKWFCGLGIYVILPLYVSRFAQVDQHKLAQVPARFRIEFSQGGHRCGAGHRVSND